AARAAELVGLHGKDLDRQLLVGEVSTRQLEALRDLGLVDVHDGRLRVDATCLELFQAVLAEVDLVATRGVVVGGHRMSRSCCSNRARCNARQRCFFPPGGAKSRRRKLPRRARYLTVPMGLLYARPY